MHESADFMYIVPPYRFSVYAMGILLGFALHKFQNTSLTQKQLNLGWLSAIACMIATVAICIGNVTYTPFHDAMFAGIGSITFCAFFAWVIFAAHLGHKSVYMPDIAKKLRFIIFIIPDALIRAFEWKYLKVGTNLAYSVYLVQFLVYHYNVGTARSSFFYTTDKMVRKRLKCDF